MDRLAGVAGEAERCTISPKNPDQEATLGAWLIHAPGQSPAWDHYLLMLVHLRDLPGQTRRASRQFPEAEHQMTLFALGRKGHPVKDDYATWWPLFPANGELQFGGATDEQALTALDVLAYAICNGSLPAEPAHPRPGREEFKRFAQSIIVGIVLPRPTP